MSRLERSRRARALVGFVLVGLVSWLAGSMAEAQEAAPAPRVGSRRTVSVYGSPARTLSGQRLPGNGYNPGPTEGRAPGRDWSTGRQVPLAKPWLRPLSR